MPPTKNIMKKRIIASVFSFLMLALSVWADKGMYTYVVSKGDDGDFKTIAEAIEAIPDYSELETLIFIKRGKYKEKLVIPESKKIHHCCINTERKEIRICLQRLSNNSRRGCG